MIVLARSVQDVTRILQILKPVATVTKTTTQDLNCTSKITTNIEPTSSTSEHPIMNIKKKSLKQNDLKLIMEETNFEEVIFSTKLLSKTPDTTTILQNTIPNNITTNKHYTSDFLKLFIANRITSMRQFNQILQQNKDLMDAFLHLSYNLTNQIMNKELPISQSAFKPVTFLEKFNDTTLDNSKLIKRHCGVFNEFLSELSLENYLPINSLLINIFDCLLYRNHKKMILAFIGQSNTGKT